MRKHAGPDTTIERVTVDGEPGFWLGGAAARAVLRATPPARSAKRRRGSPATPWSGSAAS